MRPFRTVGVVLALAVLGSLLAVATPARAGASTGTLATGVSYSSNLGGLPLATEAPAAVYWYSGYTTLSYTESAGTFQAGSQVFSGAFRSYWSGYSPNENVTGGSGSLTVSVYGTDPRGQQLSGSLDGTYTRAGTALTAPVSGAITIAGPTGSATATVALVVTADITFYPYDSGVLFRPRGAEVAATYEETSLPANRPPSAPTRLAPTDGKVFEAKETQVFTVRATDPESAPYKARVTVKDANGVATTFETTYAASGADATGTPPWSFGRGNYTWTAVAIDPWGAESGTSSTGRFSVAPFVEPTPVPAEGPTTRVSVTTAGSQADGTSDEPAVSGDGRFVAFVSDAPNLVPNDTNGHADVFVRDRGTGVTTRVSVTSTGGQADRSSADPSISADGRYVVFESWATNLVGGDTNGWGDVFIHDRAAGTTERVSVATGGGQGDHISEEASMSSDGRYIAFTSGASNLVGSDTNNARDIFVRDRVAGTTTRISVSSAGVQTNGGSFEPAISGDGRQVAFVSYALWLVSGEENYQRTVYIRDIPNMITSRAVASTTGGFPNGHTDTPALSHDGRYLGFTSYATNIVTPDGGVTGDVFIRDRQSGATTRANLDTGGQTVEAYPSGGYSMSSDGRYVAFVDYRGLDVHVRDRTANTTTQVTMDSWGMSGNDLSLEPAMSGDGRWATFYSAASNLVHADTNLAGDVFAYDLKPSTDCVGEGSTPGLHTPVGCVTGYGAHAASSRLGLEDFMPYRSWDVGSGTAYANMFNGNLVVQHTDVDAPGHGLNMRLGRTYNLQQSSTDGPLGKGWRLGIADGDGLIEGLLQAVTSVDVGRIVRIVGTEDQFDFVDADGTRHHFIKGGLDGPGWHSPPGVNLTLSDQLDASGNRWYKATRPDGVHYEFRPVALNYYLTRIADRKGNALTFNYTPGTSPVLSSITDTVGRSMTLTWSGSYVSNIRYAADGAVLDTAYTVAGGKLTSITEAAGTSAARTTTYGYDTNERLVSVTDARNGVTTFAHTNGQLTRVTDRGAKQWALAYTGTSCVPSVGGGTTAMCLTDPDGHISVWTSNPDGNLVHRRDEGDQTDGGAPRRNDRQYVWRDNRLVKEMDEAGKVDEYDYNPNGQVTEVRSTGSGEPTVVTRLGYQDVSPGVADLAEARVAAGTHDERVLAFANNPDGTMAFSTDAEGKRTTFSYYGRGLLRSVTDANGKATTYGDTALADGGYHSSGQPRRIVDATGAAMSFAFDFLGRQTSATDRNGKVSRSEYDIHGNKTKEIDELGQATTHCFDANDNEVLTIKPKAVAPSCAMTEADAYVTRRTYDARDLVTSVLTKSDGQLRKTTYAHDGDGEVREVLQPRSFDTATGAQLATVQKATYVRYPNNRVAAFIDEEGHRTDTTHTPDGHLRTVTKPQGSAGRNTTTYTYNGRGQVLTELEVGHSAPTANTYNVHGDRIATRTAKGATTTFGYDRMSRLTRTVDPHGRTSRRVYDAVGNLLTSTQPKDVGGELVTNYTYTARNEIDRESDPADAARQIDYDYDGEGNQRFRHDRYNGAVERTTEQTFRDDGKVSQRIASFASGTSGRHVTAYGYDANGNTTSVTATLDGAASPNVSSVSATYTTADEVASWTETLWNPTGGSVAKTSTYAYLPDGLLASRVTDGQTTSYGWQRNGLEHSTTPWGAAGAVTSERLPNGSLKRQVLPGGTTVDQAYDIADRLTSRIARRADGTVLAGWDRIAHDDDDNRLAEHVSQRQVDGTERTGTGTYGYDSANRMTSAKHPFEDETVPYVLDDSGNIVTETDAKYGYTNNRLVSKQALPDGPTSTYAHDHFGNQTSESTPGVGTTATTYDAASHSRRVTSPDGTWVEYAYDGFDRMVRRHESTGEVTLFFHDQGSSELGVETNAAGTVTTRYILDGSGEVIANETVGTGGRGWYIEDTRGNLSQMVDGTAAVKRVFAYDPFGKEKPALTSKASGWDSRLRFQMAPRDPKTGTYSLGPRLLDPTINRFVGADHYVAAAANMDLALDPLTGNRYLYAGANPAGLIDDGHAPQKKCGRWDFGCKARKLVKNSVFQAVATGIACTVGPAGCIAATAAFSVVNNWSNCKNGRVRACAVGVGTDAVLGAVKLKAVKNLRREPHALVDRFGGVQARYWAPSRKAVWKLRGRNSAIIFGLNHIGSAVKRRAS